MNEPVIQIRDLSFAFDERPILRDINLDIFPNEITVILGTSGCGKTTLLKQLIGILKPDRGSVSLFGRNIIGMDEKEFNALLRRVGVLFQNGALLNSISIYENIAVPLQQHTTLTREISDYLIKLKLELVGLGHAAHLFPAELSGGMRKRAALARALALDPQILFADEPGAGLDPVTAAALDQLLLSLKDKLNMTLAIVTHEVSSIKRIADRIIYLHNGSVLFSGSMTEALKSDLPELKNFFG